MEDAAADGWERLIDPKTNREYYAHTRTRQTSWLPPPEVAAVVPAEPPPYVKLSGGWFQYVDEASGRFYYYHLKTQKTVWSMPLEARPPAVASRETTVFGPIDGTEEALTEEEEEEEEEEGDEEDGEEEEEDDDDDDAEDGSAVVAASGGGEAVAAASRLSSVKFSAPSADELARKAAKREARRLRLLEEILLTERTYVSALRTLDAVYLLPLRTVADKPKAGQIFSHADLDAIFMNVSLIIKVNEAFLGELEAEISSRGGEWPAVRYGAIIQRAAKQLKGCYTRYVTNYNTAQAHLDRLEKTDDNKRRYLEVCKSHPDANGLDIRSLLIQPVQRVPRYRMLLDELLSCTDEAHADEAPLREALERVCDVAMHINEEKRSIDERERMREMIALFSASARESAQLEKELVTYERRLLRQGCLVKVRAARRQQRHVFLCSDVLLYAASREFSSGSIAPVAPPSREKGAPARGSLLLKGKIWLNNGARVETLPSTEHTPHAFAVVARNGKGYTWLAESEGERAEWCAAIGSAIETSERRNASFVRGERAISKEGLSFRTSLMKLGTKTLAQRAEAVRAGSALAKYNQRDGKCSQRWVKVVGTKVLWGDVKSKACTSELDLATATALQHGPNSSAFLKQTSGKNRVHYDWQCFSIVTRERTLDLAADTAECVLDWYLAIAQLVPQSTEPLLDEEALRARLTMQMM